jgi:hypothetical protein
MAKTHSAGHGGFTTHAPTLEAHAGRTEDRASQLRQHGSSVGSTSMPGHALGSLGSSHAGALNSHYQRAGTAVQGAGERMSTIAGNERTNASNYRNADDENARRFSSIMTDTDSSTHQSMPGVGGHSSTPGPSAPPPAPPAPPPLVGRDPKTGKPVQFQPGDVDSIPLHDANGKLIGVSFPTKPADSTKVPQWAGMNRTSDGQFSPAHQVPPPPTAPAGTAPKWAFDAPQNAPWSSAGTPVYVHAHANPNAFAVNVNGQKVQIDGTTHGQVIAGNQHYQQAAAANPNSPLVMMSCNSARPGGTAAEGVASYLHGHGDGRDVYAPTGTGVRRISPGAGTSNYGVGDSVDASGNKVPGSFQHYPAPPPPPAPTPAPTQGGTP